MAIPVRLHTFQESPELASQYPLLWRNPEHGRIQWDYADFNERFNSEAFHASKAANPTGFVESLYDLSQEEHHTCVGFKSLYYNYSYDQKHKELLSYFLANKDIKIIHLKRSNIFKMFCSMGIAKKRQQKGMSMNAYNPGDVEHSINITVDMTTT